MQRLFDRTFWKMLLGFCAVLVVVLAGIFVTNFLSKSNTQETATLEIVQ